MLSFAVWTEAAIYVFAAGSATRAWLWLAGLTLVMGLAAFLPSELGVRP
jgi:hypothetical protein